MSRRGYSSSKSKHIVLYRLHIHHIIEGVVLQLDVRLNRICPRRFFFRIERVQRFVLLQGSIYLLYLSEKLIEWSWGLVLFFFSRAQWLILLCFSSRLSNRSLVRFFLNFRKLIHNWKLYACWQSLGLIFKVIQSATWSLVRSLQINYFWQRVNFHDWSETFVRN